jgi:hypothetical protein
LVIETAGRRLSEPEACIGCSALEEEEEEEEETEQEEEEEVWSR